MPLEEPVIRVERPIPLPVLVLFWVSAAALIEGAIYEFLRIVWYLTLEQRVPENVSLLNLVFLPIGIGLIKRRPNSRSCFQTLLVLLFILILFITGSEMFFPGNTSLEGSGWPEWIFVTLVAVWSVAALWCFNRYEGYFNNPELSPREKRNETALIWTIVIIAIVSSLTLISREHKQEKRFGGIFAVQLDFYAIDSESEQLIENCKFELEHTDSQHLSQRYGRRKKEGIEINSYRLSGFSEESFTIKFSVDGYEDTERLITKEIAESGESEFFVQLRRLPKSSAEKVPPDEATLE